MSTKIPSSVKIIDKQIASITEPFKDPKTGLYDIRLIKKGLFRQEIEKYFPANPQSIAKARKKRITKLEGE